MSHIVSIAVKLTDLDAIKATCRELKLTFKPNQKTYRWYGRSVGDTPLPAGFTAAELGQCEHAIEVPGADYDIGLARAKDGQGYVMLFDYWGPGQSIPNAIGGYNADGTAHANRFVQLYGVHKATREAVKLGYTVRRENLKNGKINLHVTGGRL